MDVTCDICKARIVYPIYFLLKPCSHTACVKCFHEMVPAKVFSRCPCSDCHEWITSSILLEITNDEYIDSISSKSPSQRLSQTGSTSTNVPTIASDASTRFSTTSNISKSGHSFDTSVREVQEVQHFEPDEQMDPFRHWALKKPKLYTGFLYVAYRFSDEEATFYKSNFKAVDSSVFIDDNSSDELVKIFARILHPLLFRRDFSCSVKERTSSMKESSNYIIPPAIIDQQDRQYLAMRCMYALSSGCVLTREEQEKILGDNIANCDRDEGGIDSTKFLAKELMVAYQKSCCTSSLSLSLKNNKQRTSSSINTHLCQQMELPMDSKREAIEMPKRLYSSQQVMINNNDKSHHVDDNDTNYDRWMKELGLFGKHSIDSGGSDSSPPIIPVIIWILSAALILSK